MAGKYRVLEELGRGGMGVVVRAEDTRLKRTVALKFLSPELTGDPEARERFIQEARAASALEHPNICNIHEIDEAPDGRLFMAMACYEGESLRDRLKKGKLEQADSLSVAVQVARGLAKAHEKGIVHRDIKPGNIFLTDDNQAKILDFGLAKLAADIRLTRTGATMGTVAYMSPEQAQGQSVDHRTDIWSLGVVLYEMVAGQLPFKGEYEQSIIHSILSREPEPLTKVSPNIPRDLEKVTLKSLEKNPVDRYRTMGDFLADLEALAEGLKPLKAKPGLLRGRILGIRKPVFYGGLAVLAGVAAFAVFGVLIPSARAEVFDSVAILPIINETGDADREYFANSLTRQLNAELYKVAALTVPPAETIMAYKGSDKPRKKIAQEIGVKAVVEVSWLQVGSRHRLIYTLSDPFRNRVIAADTLEREGEDILYLQSEFARAVVAAVKVAVTPSEQAFLAGGKKVNPEAYDLVIQGIDFWLEPKSWQKMSPQDVNWKAIDYFQSAIDLDSNLALAHAWKAHIYSVLAMNGLADEREVYPKSRESVQRALELDQNLAQAHATLGGIKWADWDFEGAEEEYKRALALEPGNELMWIYYEIYLASIGRSDEAIMMFNRWVKEHKKTLKVHANYVPLYYLWAGRPAEAIQLLKAQVSSEPDQPAFIYQRLAIAYALNGMYSEALAEMDKVKDMPGTQEDIGSRLDSAWILAVSGHREESLKELERLKALIAPINVDPAYYTACLYAGLGDNDKAFEYLDEAYESHSTLMVGLLGDYWLLSLHGDPRFEELARKIGFPVVPRADSRIK